MTDKPFDAANWHAWARALGCRVFLVPDPLLPLGIGLRIEEPAPPREDDGVLRALEGHAEDVTTHLFEDVLQSPNGREILA